MHVSSILLCKPSATAKIQASYLIWDMIVMPANISYSSLAVTSRNSWYTRSRLVIWSRFRVWKWLFSFSILSAVKCIADLQDPTADRAGKKPPFSYLQGSSGASAYCFLHYVPAKFCVLPVFKKSFYYIILPFYCFSLHRRSTRPLET